VFPDEIDPRPDPPGLHLAADELMTKRNGRVMPFVLVDRTDPGALPVVHQRKIDRTGKRAFGELHRRAGVDERAVLQDNGAEIIDDRQRHTGTLLWAEWRNYTHFKSISV